MRDQFTIGAADAGKRLDQFVHLQLPQFSRAYLQKLIREGRIVVQGRARKMHYRVRVGEIVDIEIPPPRPLTLEPEAVPLKILFEDDDLLVLDKFAGMVVHPAAGHQRGTLVSALLAHCGINLSGIGGVLRPGIVHRLDKCTSGCMVVAKNDFAHHHLSEQFRTRTVKKTYLALVMGRVESERGEITATLGRHPTHRKKIAAEVAGGRAAWTGYEVEKRFAEVTLVRAYPRTGRTHQIRVHLAKLGHPIAGDLLYGKRTKIDAPRQMLHAYQLAFVHPRTGKWLEFTSPIPEDMKRVLKRLNGNESKRIARGH